MWTNNAYWQNPVIPPTITDQIRLWELERSRLTFTEGVMYNQFLSQADFEVLRDYAKVCIDHRDVLLDLPVLFLELLTVLFSWFACTWVEKSTFPIVLDEKFIEQ